MNMKGTKVYLLILIWVWGSITLVAAQKNERTGDKVPSYVKDTTISATEKEALDKFRNRTASLPLLPYMRKDLNLIRWLRAAYFDVDRAEILLKKNLQWRKDNNVDSILEEDFSDMDRKGYRYSLKGRDKEGKPLLFVNLRDWDLRSALISGDAKKLERYMIYMFEDSVRQVRELGEQQGNVTQGIFLINADGVNLIQHFCVRCVPFFLQMISIVDNHYIGWCQKLFSINMPGISEPVVRAARAAFHPITNKSVFVYGTTKSSWWKELLKDFTVDQIPVEIGGKFRALDDESEDYIRAVSL